MRNNPCLPGTLCLRSLLAVVLVLVFFAAPRALMADSASVYVQGVTTGETEGTTFQTFSEGGAAAGYTASGTAEVSLATFSLGVEASVSLSPSGTFAEAQAGAVAEFDLSVSNGPTSGTIVLPVTVSGTQQATGCPILTCSDSSNLQFNYYVDRDDPIAYNFGEIQNSPGSGTTAYTISIPYDPSDPASVLLIFNLSVSCQGVAATCSETTDYLDPLQITGAQVYDTSGNLVTGAVVTSASGFNPNGSGPVSSTPEPSNLVLMAVGLLFVGVAFMRTRLA